jgi:hypothetical protein
VTRRQTSAMDTEGSSSRWIARISRGS